MNDFAAPVTAADQARPDIAALRDLAVFSGLEDRVLERLARLAEARTLPPGTLLFEQGSSDVALHVLLSGQISTFRTTPDGTVTVIDVIRPPGHLGLQALLSRLPALIGAQTVTGAEILSFDPNGLLALLTEEPTVAGALLRAEALDVRALVLQVCDLKLRTTAQRLGHYLLSLAQDPSGTSATLRLPFDKRLLAARLGCRQENLSRAFATLREIGVETHGARVVLKDLARLRTYAVAFDEPAGG